MQGLGGGAGNSFSVASANRFRGVQTQTLPQCCGLLVELTAAAAVAAARGSQTHPHPQPPICTRTPSLSSQSLALALARAYGCVQHLMILLEEDLDCAFARVRLCCKRAHGLRESCGTCGSAASIACAPGAASCLPRDMPCVETRTKRASSAPCAYFRRCVHMRMCARACVRACVCVCTCVRARGGGTECLRYQIWARAPGTSRHPSCPTQSPSASCSTPRGSSTKLPNESRGLLTRRNW